MKTIEEAAKEYVIQLSGDGDLFGKLKKPRGAGIELLEAFKSGVEFAQRWIPIEEDLPTSENYEYERCLWKNANGTIWFGSAYQSQKPTHWRPLERK